MTPIQQLKALAESARGRQQAFRADAKRYIEKADEAAREAMAFEQAITKLERTP